MKSIFFHVVILLVFGITGLFLSLFFFNSILHASTLVIPYSLEPFDICEKFPLVWHYFKTAYLVLTFLSWIIIGNSIYSIIFKNISFKEKSKNIKKNKYTLSLTVGNNGEEEITIPEKSLYQNMLITGTTGSGKTSSAMYPFCKQLIEYEALNPEKKLGMLILDVKGNFYKQVLEFSKNAFREDDVILIRLGGNYTYNPIDKPNLKASVLSDRLKTILLLFSPNNSDDYWLDKASQVLAEGIKICRLYNDNYVTFSEIHKLIFSKDYFSEKIADLRKIFQNAKLAEEQCFELLSALDFFENEFKNLDDRVLSIVKSEISRITSMFISDYTVRKTFCPSRKDITFSGFQSCLEQGKIVVLSMNLAEYQNLAKFMAAYLKLDFQSEVLSSLSHLHNIRPSVFLCDEFHEFVTRTDAGFFAQSREARCINIVATQSYSSLVSTLKDSTCMRVLTQNLINKLWFRTDDSFTIEEIQKQLGKEEKEKTSYTVSENAKETNYHYLTNRFHSNSSNLSESFNTYTQNDFVYDTNFFTRELQVFDCLAFLSDGEKIIEPCKLKMTPYFQFNSNEGRFFNEKKFKP